MLKIFLQKLEKVFAEAEQKIRRLGNIEDRDTKGEIMAERNLDFDRPIDRKGTKCLKY